MKPSYRQGVLWAWGTALISGVSIYVNKFGVAQVSDPLVFTTVKNSLVAVGFLAALGLLASGRELRAFTVRQWTGWLALGLIGGGIPFLLFFQGLTMASAASASLIQKTMFIWVALLAVPLLGERLGWWQFVGLGIIAAGQFFLQPLTRWGGWGTGETLILIATLLWACETIIAKKVLAGVSAHTGALGRMGVGALVMWGFLSLTSRSGTALTLNGTQWMWVLVTSVFLLGYVWTWYRALKTAPAALVTSVLTIGAIITLLLSAVIDHQTVSAPQIGAMVLLIVGAAVFVFPSVCRPRRAVEAV